MSRGCTCGPHPRLNLTTAYMQYHNQHNNGTSPTTNEELESSCHEKIRQACRSHGCFHVSINLTNTDNNEDLPIKCLAKSIAHVEKEMESLFSPLFLENTGADLNGGLVDVHFKDGEVATFRGRTAESGDELQCHPEPKLSWEFHRCRSAIRADDAREDSFHVENDAWNLLPSWTAALHSVASVVIHSLGISQQVVLNEKSCDCSHKISDNKHYDKELSLEKCNVDLLRCFRYDAIPPDEKDRFGSSPHTDWGCLTVVFQDDKGGLQTYCHACEKWSDVVAAVPERNNTTGNTINLFVHVGDFLSLATHGEGTSHHPPIWPSPRHRVVCPTKELNDECDESSQCRRSLVYFAYPPPNVSLADAQAVVEPLICNDSFESSIVLQNYSLLHDQSQQQAVSDQLDRGSQASFESYLKMRRRPFGEVIQEKWDQVQRS